MEKQPVDDLFARKLRGVEAPVRAGMFSEVQQRMSAKPLPVRRSVAGWWSATSAACVLVLLWFLYRADSTRLPGTVTIAYKQKSVKAERIVTIRKDQSANVPGREREGAVRKESRREDYNSQSAQASVRYQQQPRPTKLSPAEDQISTLSVRVKEQTVVAHPQEFQQVTALSTIMTPFPVERVSQQKKPSVERTIILTIDEPQLTTTLASYGSDSPARSELPMHQNGLSGLFGKLRQLKNGEVLARITTDPAQSNQKNRFGRVLTEVKESLKNETTLELD